VKSRSRAGFLVGCLVIVVIGLYFRSAGIWRGLDHGVIFHPDSPKQVLALENYLHGQKVWYMDSLFYDGYPYGLNVLDKQIISVIYTIARPIATILNPALHNLDYPPREKLHYWANFLRVLYGVVTLVLAILVAFWLTQSRACALLAGLLAAIAPLSSTVTHSATGDVGVDLFVMLMLAALTLLSRKSGSSLLPAAALAGLLGGMAFGCKYQGALALFIVGATVLLAMDLTRIRNWLKVSGIGVVTLLCTVAGAFMVTPALHVHTKSAWKNILRNFEFIQNYNVPKEFIELPLTQKMRIGLSENIPIVVEALGWVLLACYMVGLLMSAMRWWVSRKGPQDGDSRKAASLTFAIALFPLFAVFVSTSLKLEVQPFHFSFLMAPLCLIAGMAIHALFLSRYTSLRVVGALLFAGTLLQLGAAAWRENFFWIREDLQVAEKHYIQESFRAPLAVDRWWQSSPDQVLKVFRVESPGLSVFRNKPARIMHPSAALWRSLHVLPGPTIEMGDDSSWIILDGPVLPRDDRSFRVGPGRNVDRNIVLYDPVPDRITLGIRSGSLPVEMSIEGPEEVQTCELDANSQKLLHIPTRPGRDMPVDQNGQYGGRIITVRCRASLGAAWVSAMSDPRELENFALTGGKTNQWGNPALEKCPLDDISARASETAFLSGMQSGVQLTTNEISLTKSDPALPAGRYILNYCLEGIDTTNEATLKVSDSAGWLVGRSLSHTVSLGKETTNITFEFAKPFTPYEVKILASCPTGSIVLKSYDLRPDTLKILQDLQAQRQGGPVADWMSPMPAVKPMEEIRVEPVSFDSILSLTSYSMPLTAMPGELIRYNFRFAIHDYRAVDFHGVGVFVHLENATGKRVCNLDIPLALTCFNTGAMVPISGTMPLDLLPGQYQVCMGLYSPGIRKRWSIKTEKYKVKKDSLRLGMLTIIPRAEPGTPRGATP